LKNAKAVSGIQVEAWSQQTKSWGMDISSQVIASGHNYKIDGLMPGNYEVAIHPIHYKDQSYIVDMTTDDLQVHFVLQDLEDMICGTIHGLETGKEVFISASSRSTNYLKTIQLTGSGQKMNYTITNVKPASDYIVQLISSDYPDQVFQNKVVSSDADLITVYGIRSGIDFTVSSGTSEISGTIHFPENAQIGDIVWIDAYSRKTGSSRSTQIVLKHGHSASYDIKGLKKTTDFIVTAWSDKYKEQFYHKTSQRSEAIFINTSDDIKDDDVNFYLKTGASISGTIIYDGKPLPGAEVMAYSMKKDEIRGTVTQADGRYILEALDQSDDYVVEAKTHDSGPYYYNSKQTTRDKSMASYVNTLSNLMISNINITISNLERISGTVRDENKKPISGIWVNASSEFQKTGAIVYTNNDGTYIINDLPESQDYVVSIMPFASLQYIPQEKTDVKSETNQLDFTLKRAFTFYGTVFDITGNPIQKASVELYSDKQNFYIWTPSDGSGKFNINCIPSANDYKLIVSSPENEDFILFSESGIHINALHSTNDKVEKNIKLKPGGKFCGYVYEIDGVTGIENVSIIASSEEENYVGIGKSDQDGYYEVHNLPMSTDYVLSAVSDLYAKEIKTGQSVSISSHTNNDTPQKDSFVNFILKPGGYIKGIVYNEEGQPIEGVRIVISSVKMYLEKAGMTDISGRYMISGLSTYDQNNNVVNDYVVEIQAVGYPKQSQGQKSTGLEVNFICTKGIHNQISGKITDSAHSAVPPEVIVLIKVFENTDQGGFINKYKVNDDSSFVLDGLQSGSYLLKIKALNAKITPDEEWIGEGGTGKADRSGAIIFHTGADIQIRYSGTWD